MRFVDFPNSYLTFSVGDETNVARIQLDAVCTLHDERAGTSEAFHLIAPCRSERMYTEDKLFLLPNYEFCGLWTERDYRIVRTGWTTDRDNPESGPSEGRFAWTRLDVRTRADARALTTDAEVVEATLANLPLVAVTELRDAASGRRAVLEYPVKTMNVARSPDRYQVDTGPLLFPLFDSSAPLAIDRIDLAHVVYWKGDRAEFVLRRPLPVREGSDVQVTDYGEIVELPAVNRILTVGMA